MTETNSHVIPFSKASCKRCGHKFYKPYYSNFDYGDVVFQTDSGEDYAYWYFLYDPIWEEINGPCEKIDPSLSKQNRRRIMAQCADLINGKNLTILHCPNCGASDTTYYITHDAPIFLRRLYWKIFPGHSFPFSIPAKYTYDRVPLVTFQEYKTLDLESRKNKIVLLFQLMKDSD